MMLNQKSSRMSAWKALYVIPLVGISLAATAETKVDYQYEGQEPEAMADTLVGKDNKNSFREKNLSEGRFIIDEEANSITMIYFDHNGNELRSQHKGMPLGQDEYYFHNGNMATPAAYEIYLKEEGAVTFTTYRSNGKKILGIVTPNNNYVTGVWDATKHPDEQETVYHMKDKQYKVRGGKYVEIEAPKIKVRDANGNEVKVSESNLVYVINGERMPEGFDLNTIDPATITSMEVLKTEKALQEYGTDKGVIVITTDPSKANEKKPVPDIYIDGKKATSEEVAALPANPKGYVEPDGTVQLITEEKAAEKKEPVPFQYLGQKPGFNGGDANEFSKWVAANLKYPEKCRQSKVQGRVTLQFTITEKGEVTDVRVLRGVNEELDKEALRVVSASPRWTPGKDKNGNIVPVIFTFPVLFQIPDSKDPSHYLEADVKPTFNGGDTNEFAKWVYSQLQYPEECKKAGITGRVSLSFVVGTDGKVRDVKVLRGAHKKLDAEALRVIKMSPDWTPGTKDGKPVPITFTFPVNFEIPDSKE